MRVTVEFDTDKLEETIETLSKPSVQAFIHGPDLAVILWDFIHNGHRRYKYDDPNNLYPGMEEAQRILCDELEDYGIDIDNLSG